MAKLRKKAKRRLLLLTILLIGIFGLVFKFTLDNESSSFNSDNSLEKENIKEEPIKTTKVSLIATGDGLVHSTVYKAAYEETSKTYDFSSMLKYTKELISNYDIRYYNQETVFDDTKSYSGYPRFNTPSEFGINMIESGFNMVSLATNHSMDMGSSSAKLSSSFWESQDGVLTHGMASSMDARNNYEIMEKNDITYTMLSYTYGTNGLGTSAINAEPYLVNIYDEETVKKDIEAVRDKVDVLIVAMHWGNEYQQMASSIQKEQATFLASLDVDIILGTHSHCIQPWEMIDDTVVFYSFGNFISNQMGAEQASVRKLGTIGMFATLDITKTVDKINNTTTIKIDNIGADLNYSYRTYNNTTKKYEYLVIPFSKMEEKYLSNYESIYNEFSNILKKYNSNINIASLPSN